MPDLTPWLPWIVFVHVAAAFVFAAGHGVSILVAFQLRREQADAGRMTALLDLSGRSLVLASAGLLTLLVAGILAGIVAGSFARLWIWLALVLLIVVGGLMTPLGTNYFNRIRAGLGIRSSRLKPEEPDPVPLPPAEMESLLAQRRPELLAAVGGIGFMVILYLMMFRPF